MPLTLYSTAQSPPCRAVLILADALGINLELKEVDLNTGGHMNLEFIKVNPQHTIPTLDDNGVVLVDSHAILAYLVGKFAKDDSLYPKDLAKRALIDSKLHFDTGYAFNALRTPVRAMIYDGQKGGLTQLQSQLILDVFLTHSYKARNGSLVTR